MKAGIYPLEPALIMQMEKPLAIRMTVNPASDIDELIERCRREEREACYILYRRYAKTMLNTAFRITKDGDDAADVVQDSFISAFRSLADLREARGFGSWLKKIVINKALNLLKKHQWEQELPEDENFDVEDSSLYEESDLSVEKIKSAIMRLPDGYRSVITLYLLEGYDHQEIADIMGITESTSKSQLNRSKKKLRELLK